jgi:16S rRNA A1518/A1519 N6-dimethyltransferase RsmA/KsgA/DIM1 with predicted DNA glycosylase/AP lyase activity
MIEHQVPWVPVDTDLGQNALELVPGRGLTTDLLRSRAQRLTAIEIDARLGKGLRERLPGTNVQVFNDDATAMPFADEQFRCP